MLRFVKRSCLYAFNVDRFHRTVFSKDLSSSWHIVRIGSIFMWNAWQETSVLKGLQRRISSCEADMLVAWFNTDQSLVLELIGCSLKLYSISRDMWYSGWLATRRVKWSSRHCLFVSKHNRITLYLKGICEQENSPRIFSCHALLEGKVMSFLVCLIT
jgi:hypothetical protein